MLRLSTYTAIWILMLLFDLTVTEDILYPKRNISLLDLQNERIARDSSGKFWKRRLLHKNEVIETVISLNKTSRLANNQVAKDTNFNGEFENMENTKRRTLIDYNGPAIIGEYLDKKSDQDFADHVRVKRNGPINDSIIHHQSNHSVNVFNSFPRNFWNRTDAINVYSGSMSEFEGSYVNSDHGNLSSALRATILGIPYSRHKRGILSKDKQHAKRRKRSVKHSKHRIKTTENGKKKHDILKSSHKPAMKKANNSKERSKKTEIMPAKTIDDESWIEKRESGNDDLNTDLARATGIIDYDKREENAVALPFVHTGRAELRVRIEKIPRNESSLINNWTDYLIGTSTCRSTALLKYDDEIANVTELVPNFDSAGREKVNNLTVEIIVKQLDYGNVSSRETGSDSGNPSFHNAESHPIGSDLSRIKDDQDLESGEYNRAEQLSDEDAKSRAKRNQEITSRRYLRSDRNAVMGSKTGFKNGRGASIESTKHEKTKYKPRDNRAARSIEEIKELAEKLVVKVNELQTYVSARNASRYTTDICVDKNADRVGIIERTSPTIFSEKKRIAKASKSENTDNRRRLARNGERVILAGKRAASSSSSSSRLPSLGGSRFARGENPIQRSKSRRKWGRWMDWSSCSVTCGKGRQIRWRHCLRDCNDAETEMEEKACQLPACPPASRTFLINSHI